MRASLLVCVLCCGGCLEPVAAPPRPPPLPAPVPAASAPPPAAPASPARPRYDLDARTFAAPPRDCLAAVIDGLGALGPYEIAMAPDGSDIRASRKTLPDLESRVSIGIQSAPGGCTVSVGSELRVPHEPPGAKVDAETQAKRWRAHGEAFGFPRSSAPAVIAATGAALDRGVRAQPPMVGLAFEVLFPAIASGDARWALYVPSPGGPITDGFAATGAASTAPFLKLWGVHLATEAERGGAVALIEIDVNGGLGAGPDGPCLLASSVKRVDGTARFASLDPAVARLRAELARSRRGFDERALRSKRGSGEPSAGTREREWIEGTWTGEGEVRLRAMREVIDAGGHLQLDVVATFGVEATVDRSGKLRGVRRVPVTVTTQQPPHPPRQLIP